MEWQPIETAPRDGTVVLVATFKLAYDVSSAAWRDGFWDMRHMDEPDESNRYDREFGSPTHWHPAVCPK